MPAQIDIAIHNAASTTTNVAQARFTVALSPGERPAGTPREARRVRNIAGSVPVASVTSSVKITVYVNTAPSMCTFSQRGKNAVPYDAKLSREAYAKPIPIAAPVIARIAASTETCNAKAD